MFVSPDRLHVEYLGKCDQDQTDQDSYRGNLFEYRGNDGRQES